MDQSQIKAILPHRPPFLLVDKIVELEPGKRAVGLKKVSDDGRCLLAQYDGKKMMPGALILEAMAQVGAVAVLSHPVYRGKTTLLAGIENACFHREVYSGEEIRLEVEIVKLKQKSGKRRGRAMVEGHIVAEADLLFVLSDACALERAVN